MPLMKLSEIKIESQVRKFFDKEDLLRLGENIQRYGLLQPLLVRTDGVLLAGERRLRAMLLAGIKEAQVIVTDKVLSDSEIRLIQLTENMHRADLSGHEKSMACAELMCMNPAWQMKDLAEHLSLDPSMVTRLLSPSRCIPAVQEALAAGKIGNAKFGIADCYELSQESPERQAELLSLKAQGASRDAIKDARRKHRDGKVAAVRVSRIKCQVPGNGATVVVSGESLSLEDMIQALTHLLSLARKEAQKGVCAKTFEKVCRDLAKKG